MQGVYQMFQDKGLVDKQKLYDKKNQSEYFSCTFYIKWSVSISDHISINLFPFM